MQLFKKCFLSNISYWDSMTTVLSAYIQLFALKGFNKRSGTYFFSSHVCSFVISTLCENYSKDSMWPWTCFIHVGGGHSSEKNIHVQIAFYSVSGKLPRPSCLKLTTLSVNKKLTFKHTCMICKNTALLPVRKNLWMQRFLSCLQKEWAPLILREQSYWVLDTYLWHWIYFKGQVDRRMRDLKFFSNINTIKSFIFKHIRNWNQSLLNPVTFQQFVKVNKSQSNTIFNFRSV